MLNIISGDLYRLRKSKSVAICMAAMILTTVFSYLILNWALMLARSGVSELTGAVHVTVSDGILACTDADIISETVSSKYYMIIFAIFVCVWVTSEFSSGAIKNTVGKGCSRVKVFLAKYITAVGIVLAMSVVSYIVAVLAGVLFVGTDGVNGAFCMEIIKYVGVQFMLLAAYVGIIVAVSELTRSMVAGIVVSVIIELFSLKLFNVIDLMLKLAGRAAIVSAFWIVVSLGVGMWHFKRTDVK